MDVWKYLWKSFLLIDLTRSESRDLCYKLSESRVPNQEVTSTELCWNSVGTEPFFLVVYGKEIRSLEACQKHPCYKEGMN